MRKKTALLSLLLALPALACNDGPSEPRVEVSLTPANPVVLVGMSLQLDARPIVPTNGNITIRNWVSSAPGVIEVDSTGLVTAKSAGSATITAQTGTGIGETVITSELAGVGLQAKDRTTCGIALNGDGYCWGYNLFGQAGTKEFVRIPVRLAADLQLGQPAFSEVGFVAFGILLQ